MKIIYNNIIPFKGFKAINLFGVIFARKGVIIDERTIRHERIHTAQMIETLVIGFYVWYVIEWLVRWVVCRDREKAYRCIGFEREAYEEDQTIDYLKSRKRFAFLKYLNRRW